MRRAPVIARALATLVVLMGAGGGEAAERLRVTAARAALYSRASADSYNLLSLETGAELELVQRAGDWYAVKVLTSAVKGAVGVKGFVSRSDVEVFGVAEPATVPAPVARPAPRAAPTPRPESVPPPAPPRSAPAIPAADAASYASPLGRKEPPRHHG